MLGYAGNLASETISTASADGKTITLTKDVTGDGVIAALGKPAAEASQAEVARARPDLPRRLAAGRGRRCSSRPPVRVGRITAIRRSVSMRQLAAVYIRWTDQISCLCDEIPALPRCLQRRSRDRHATIVVR